MEHGTCKGDVAPVLVRCTGTNLPVTCTVRCTVNTAFDQYSALYRYKSTYDQYSGVTKLTIYNLREEDEGEYTCKAINSLGEASTSSTLLSQGESGPLFFH